MSLEGGKQPALYGGAVRIGDISAEPIEAAAMGSETSREAA